MGWRNSVVRVEWFPGRALDTAGTEAREGGVLAFYITMTASVRFGDRRGSAAYIVLTKYINNNDIVTRCVRIHIHNPIDGNHYGLGYYPFTCDLLVLKY